jgi:hypothetical protein
VLRHDETLHPVSGTIHQAGDDVHALFWPIEARVALESLYRIS